MNAERSSGRTRPELVRSRRITDGSRFSLRSRLGFVPAEISERFSSSSLPPSFALGRFAVFLFSAGGIALSLQ